MERTFDIVRVTSPLREETWSFRYISDGQIVLQEYELRERPSTRHKHRSSKNYRSWNTRDSFPEDQVPLPPDVAAEALAAFTAGLRIVRTYERE